MNIEYVVAKAKTRYKLNSFCPMRYGVQTYSIYENMKQKVCINAFRCGMVVKFI